MKAWFWLKQLGFALTLRIGDLTGIPTLFDDEGDCEKPHEWLISIVTNSRITVFIESPGILT
ncbi:hypothetical protein PGT21_021924 [Puccinia graminis f. sp. tritici]|uniref:Uncharacterized protein n=1 Tax=Puccinia graminis f. sp. tritici TaxID=56615 RepID=A0A5B0LSY0_PUCGR|nr:hypothetical protein PGTUg99_010076 [Puccinia graminis f. sp. tritici]KAA1071874.1 hypothetical protein PGT21_021924 [Puccinia graminis f. sp. tritici]